MLELQKLCKNFSDFPALKGVSLSVQEGDFLCLLGPSGCGKTTLLRIVAGLTDPDSGTVLLDKKSLLDCPTHLRPIHTVFQRYALFPHMTIAENLAFPLKMKKLQKSEISKQVKWALDLVRLTGYENRTIETLSGGQQQRVALARCLVGKPRIVLLDEPLSALDPHLRKSMQKELREIQKSLGITFIMVTHDQEEAFAMASHIALFECGHLHQFGTPQQLYQNPANLFVAEFLGTSITLPVLDVAAKRLATGDTVKWEKIAAAFDSSRFAFLMLRPEHVKWSAQPITGQNCIDVQLRTTVFHGSHYECWGQLKNGQEIRWTQNYRPESQAGYICWSASDGLLLNSIEV